MTEQEQSSVKDLIYILEESPRVEDKTAVGELRFTTTIRITDRAARDVAGFLRGLMRDDT